MLLRSSSTPILGSLLSSSAAVFSESPNNGFQLHHQSLERATSSSIIQGIACRYSLDFSERDPSTGMRRTRSEGNIKDLLSNCSDGFQSQRSLKPSSSRRPDPILEAIPSFSVYNSRKVEEDEEEKLQEQDDDQIAAEFSFLEHAEQNSVGQSSGERCQRASQPLFLARGLGIDRLGSGFMNIGGDGGLVMVGGDSGDGDGRDGNYSVKTDYGGEGYEVELYYKRAIEEDPSNAMILRNYAQFLHQCKRDLLRAEEYYSRAILAGPGDADTISQYGKLVWELHGDFERASTYIERAANMDQNNSFVQAAYASFLWETGDEVGEDEDSQELSGVPFHLGTCLQAST